MKQRSAEATETLSSNAARRDPDAVAASALSYNEALTWLFGTQLFGIKLGLDNVQRLLRELELPAREQRIIHVAGTNGKGSVCAMIDAICRAAGYRTGLFTSPHLVTFRERIQVDGELISEQAVAAGLTSIRNLIADWQPHPTFFEIATALALQHFKASLCEIVVLETGMGGRLDATNAVTPVVSVLTPIALDHQKWLGDTVAAIAAEKAGIIKPGMPVVSAIQPPEAAAAVREKADELCAPLEFVRGGGFPTSLSGAHQKENAALAVAALRAGGITLDDGAIDAGLQNVKWPARFQRWDERIVIDGAHNPAGARIVAQTWQQEFGSERATIVLAVLSDKDLAGIIAALAPIASRILLPRVRSERAVPPEELARIVRATADDIPATVVPSLLNALEEASSSSDRILITGSLHFAGEALATLGGEAEQLEDCLQ